MFKIKILEMMQLLGRMIRGGGRGMGNWNGMLDMIVMRRPERPQC